MTRRNSLRAQAQEIYREMAIQEMPLGSRIEDTPLPNPPPQGGREQAVLGGGEKSLTARVRALYEGSAVPVREIAGVAGVTERTIYKYAAKQNWKPRYRWLPDGARPQGAKPSPGERSAERGHKQRARHFAPVKGAGGRFISREEAGMPFATGLKATDPAAAARAGTACGRAAQVADEAEARAAAEHNAEQRLRAMAAVNRALDELTDYLDERDKDNSGKPEHPGWPRRPVRPPPENDEVEAALRLSVAVASDWWRSLQADAGITSPRPRA